MLVDPQIMMIFLLFVFVNSVSGFWMRGCEDSVAREKRIFCYGDSSNCQERLYQNVVKTEKECEKKVNFLLPVSHSTFVNL